MATTEDLGIQGIDDIEPLDTEGSAVYRARQPVEDRMVVVKLLEPGHRPLVPKRFDIRRKALSQFAEHPGVVPVYDSGLTTSGQRYLVMPYYRTGSLADQLAHGPMPWHRAAELTMRAAETVAIAHDLDLVLGDLKPSSIVLADASSPLVSVYGMATKRTGASRASSFASPEMQREEDLFPSADVYSLTLTLAALIAGRPPDPGPLSGGFLSEVRSLAADRVFEVIDHGLEVNQANRYRSCRHLAQVLAAAISGDPIEPPHTAQAIAAGPDSDEPFDLDALLGGTNGHDDTSGTGGSRPASEHRPGPRARPQSEEPEPTSTHPAVGDQQPSTAKAASTMTTVSEDPEPTSTHPAVGPPEPDISQEPESTDAHPAIGKNLTLLANGDHSVSEDPEPTSSHPAVGTQTTPAQPSPSEPPLPSQPPTPPADPATSAPTPTAPATPSQPPSPAPPAPTPTPVAEPTRQQDPPAQNTPPRQHAPPVPPAPSTPPAPPAPGQPIPRSQQGLGEQGGHHQAGYGRPGVPPQAVRQPLGQPHPHQQPHPHGHGEPMPIRGFERRPVYEEAGNPLTRFLDPVLSLVSEGRAGGGLLAVLGFVLVAAVVGTIVVRDFTGDDGPEGLSAQDITSSSTGSTGPTFPPTNVAPILIEPPRTNSTIPTTQPPTFRRTTTTGDEETSTSGEQTTSSGQSSSSGTGSGSTTTSGGTATSEEPPSSSGRPSSSTTPTTRDSTTSEPTGSTPPTISLPVDTN